jgi:hypothetical protein
MKRLLQIDRLYAGIAALALIAWAILIPLLFV